MIKVLKLKLENFARVATGLQLNILDINFEELSNELFLFVGVNGSGKTSILHSIHPFAYNVSIGDNIPNAEFIVSGQDGEKYIKYLVDDDIYEITHKYLRKQDDTITVKSFISKNGEELNPSGTVSTFKDIILEVFELDETYLSLLSLGNTVEGFVNYTGGDRKQLMTKIFDKLNIYSRYYKNASLTVRNLKSVLNNVTTKLDRYESFDRDEAKRTLLQIEQKIEQVSDEIKDLSVNIGGISQKISSNEEFIADYQTKKNAFMQILTKIDSLKGKIQTAKDIPVLQQDLAEIIKKIDDRRIDKATFELSLKSALDYVDNLKTDLYDAEQLVDKLNQDIDLTELDMTKANIEAKIVSLDVPDNLILPMSKDKLIRANIYLEELKGLCIDFATDVKYPEVILETGEKFFKKETMEAVDKTYQEKLQSFQQFSYIKNTGSLLENDFTINNECEFSNNECPYVKFYNSYKDAVSKKLGELENEFNRKKDDIEMMEDILNANKVYKRLISYIQRNPDILQIPKDIFDPDNFVFRYLKTREVCNTDAMSTLVDLAERYDTKLELEAQLTDIEQKRKNNEQMREQHEAMTNRISSLKEKIQSSQSSISYYRNELPALEADIAKLDAVRSDIEKTIAVSQELEDCRQEMNEIKSQLSSMESKSHEIDDLQSQVFKLKRQSDDLETLRDKLQKEKEEINLTLSTIKNLESEQFTLMTQYDEAESIRNAVSPVKGIPLEFIKKYIKGDLIQMVNELLELVYHGDLLIDPRKVIINESEFTIPYYKKGTFVSDISHASDGERAVMSLAFSLSLARITSKKYNILLLDEMDTSLDGYSRGKYIDMIVAYMKLIKCKQVFLISHNSMFDNYPVNVLLTSDMNISNVSSTNILQLWKKKGVV